MYRAIKNTYRHFLANTTVAIQAKTALDYYLLARRYRRKLVGCSAEIRAILENIEQVGFSVIPKYRDRHWCSLAIADIDEMFAARPYDIVRGDDLRVFGAEYFSNRIREFADDEHLVELAEKYFGGFQAFTLANILRFTPGNRGSGGGWHRDGYYRELKAILYLSDVGPTNGPFQIVARSNNFTELMRAAHTLRLKWRQNRLVGKEDEIERQYPDDLKTLVGEAGTLIVFDTSCIHRGMPIVEGSRYALTNYCWHANYYSTTQLDHVLADFQIVAPEAVREKVLLHMRGGT